LAHLTGHHYSKPSSPLFHLRRDFLQPRQGFLEVRGFSGVVAMSSLAPVTVERTARRRIPFPVASRRLPAERRILPSRDFVKL
jgi:hypothetical protein